MALNGMLARQVTGLLRLRLIGLHRRSLQYIVYGAAIPWLFMTIVAGVTPEADSLRLTVGGGFVSCCFMTLRAPAALFASERLSGVQGLLMGTGGLERSAYLIAHIFGSAALMALPFGVLVGTAAIRDVAMPHSVAWIIPTLLLAATLHGLALVIARSNVGLATVLLAVDLAVTMMIVFCPVFYRSDAVPAAIWPIVQYAPPTLAVDAVMQLWRGNADGWWPTILLAGWAIIFLVIGYRRIRLG
jgi:hypothetical protein